MDSFELNKIIGALLGVIFVVFSVSLISGAIFSSEPPEEAGYAIAVKEGAEAGAAEEEPAEPQDIAPLLAKADPSHGESLFKRCQACHTVTKGGPNKAGPNLWGVVNRAPASHEGFSYSSAMKEFGKNVKHWDYEHLNKFLADPRGYIKGTAMTFAGIGNIQDRADIIAFLRQHADKPAPLPEPKAKAEEEGGEAAQESQASASEGGGQKQAGAPKIDTLLAKADPSKGANIFKRCQACHNIQEGGPNMVGPNLWGVVGRAPASHKGFNYSPAMKDFAKNVKHWDYEDLSKFLADPGKYIPGTKMTFPGLSDIDDRANVIAFLRQHAKNPEPLPSATQGDSGTAPSSESAHDSASSE